MACANQTHINLARIPVADRAKPPQTNWLGAFALTCVDLWQWRRGCLDLLEIDRRLLDDAGLTREQAERQAGEWLDRWLRRRGGDGA